MKYKIKWDLSQSLNGVGTDHTKIEAYLKDLSKRIAAFDCNSDNYIPEIEDIGAHLEEVGSLICCMTAVDCKDGKATRLEAIAEEVNAAYSIIHDKVSHRLSTMKEAEFQKLLKRFPKRGYVLEEMRRLSKEKLPLDKEEIITNLSPSGHSAMTTMYYTYIGELKFPYKDKLLNVSKVENLLDESDEAVRKEAFKSMEKTFTEHENIFGTLLNSIVDYRLKVFGMRKYPSFLHETLNDNRVSQATVDAMWDSVRDHQGAIKRLFAARAKNLGKSSLSYNDIHAPIGSSDETKISWDDGCKLIIEHFGKYSPKMAEFASMALENGWVDAATSDVKRAGGFCTMLPLMKQSRILMSYTDTFGSVATLAHELGHAFHTWVLKDREHMLQQYPMNIAETASTFCEMVVADAAIDATTDPKQKKILLDDKLSRHAVFCTDLFSRYLFDVSLHESRGRGFIAPEKLTEMTVMAQREAFAGALDDYFGHFWCYKMHHYFTDVSFYNWTYSFGYLFSLNLYLTLKDDPKFEEKYTSLLFDSGCMSIEELAAKHLGVDIRKKEFWSSPLQAMEKEIAEYESLPT